MGLNSMRDVAALALAAGRPGEGLVIATVVANRSEKPVPVAARLMIFQTGERRGAIDPALDALLAERAVRCLADRKSQFRSYRIESEPAVEAGVTGGDLDVFFEVLAPDPVLVIVGAGHIAVPLSKIADLAEFRVVIVDDRPEYASRDRFPDVDELLVGPYRTTLARVPIDVDTFVVLVTRGHVHDQACLEQVLGSQASYIGMIGSRRRVRTVMRHAVANGCDPDQLRRVFAPVGLDIGAQTPTEIAIAILAEIINVRRGGLAPSLALGDRLGI